MLWTGSWRSRHIPVESFSLRLLVMTLSGFKPTHRLTFSNQFSNYLEHGYCFPWLWRTLRLIAPVPVSLGVLFAAHLNVVLFLARVVNGGLTLSL